MIDNEAFQQAGVRVFAPCASHPCPGPSVFYPPIVLLLPYTNTFNPKFKVIFGLHVHSLF